MGFDVRAYLRSLSRFGIKPGLERIRALLAKLGDPHKEFDCLHVGGTNGKGSISAFAAGILRAAGYRVGLYTSPHLVRYNERIQINGIAVSDEDLATIMHEVAEAAHAVKDELGTDPTEFEVGTATAFLYFARQRVDVAVIEVGLGGRLDSTNVIDARAAALGSISKDHTAVLGPTLTEIAAEKAGIFRPEMPVVCSPQVAEVERVLREEARKLQAPVIWVREMGGARSPDPPRSSLEVSQSEDQDLSTVYEVLSWTADGGRVNVRTPWNSYCDVHVPLLGRHQLQNAATAVTLVDAFTRTADESFRSISLDDVVNGVAGTRWPGRLELVPGRPDLLLDGVHNPGGAEALAKALEGLWPGRRHVFVMALLGEKDAEATMAPLLPLASEIFVTRPASARTEPASLQTLVDIAQKHNVHAHSFDRAADALNAACRAAGEDGLVCVCGSLYLVGEVKAQLEVVGDGQTN